MKRIRTVTFIISMLILLGGVNLFGQSIPKAIKFLNLEWEVSSEEAVASIKKESEDISFRRNKNLDLTYKEMGFDEEFVANDFQFVSYKWLLTLRFSKNKLIEILLRGRNINESKIIEEIEKEFGEYETIPPSEDKKWKAEDGSELFLVHFGSAIIALLYRAPGYEKYIKIK